MAYLPYIKLIVEASKPLPATKYWEHHDSPWTAPDKPLSASRVAILGSAGVHLKGQPPFENTNDASLRLLHRKTPAGELLLSHPAPINTPGRKDINSVFPLQRFLELEADGVIGQLADEHPSIIGTIWKYDAVAGSLGPAIARELQRQAVDLLCLFPL